MSSNKLNLNNILFPINHMKVHVFFISSFILMVLILFQSDILHRRAPSLLLCEDAILSDPSPCWHHGMSLAFGRLPVASCFYQLLFHSDVIRCCLGWTHGLCAVSGSHTPGTCMHVREPASWRPLLVHCARIPEKHPGWSCLRAQGRDLYSHDWPAVLPS